MRRKENVNERFTIHFNVTTSVLHNTAQKMKNEEHLLMNTDTLIFRQLWSQYMEF